MSKSFGKMFFSTTFLFLLTAGASLGQPLRQGDTGEERAIKGHLKPHEIAQVSKSPRVRLPLKVTLQQCADVAKSTCGAGQVGSVDWSTDGSCAFTCKEATFAD